MLVTDKDDDDDDNDVNVDDDDEGADCKVLTCDVIKN